MNRRCFMKKCNRCHEDKPFDQFHKNKKFADGYAHYCKICRSEYGKNSSRKKEYYKEWSEKNKDKNKIRRKNYYEDNKDAISEKHKKWYQDTKLERNKYYQKRRTDNINVKIKENCSRRIRSAIKSAKTDKTLDLIGCSIGFLKSYLEDKFQDGMSWDNYGEWHIDHIKPCSSFDLSDVDQQKLCFNYLNLQPLWAIDNIKKSNK